MFQKGLFINRKATLVGSLFFAIWLSSAAVAGSEKTIVFETQYLTYVIAEDGSNLHFIDKQTGVDHCVSEPASKFAVLTCNDGQHAVSAVTYDHGKMTLQFGSSGIGAVVGVEIKKNYLTFEVVDISDSQKAADLSLINLSLNVKGEPGDPFAGCAVVLNLHTFSSEIPGFNKNLGITCSAQDGILGAKAALLGCPSAELRAVLKEVVSDHQDLPQTTVGGPWALDAKINQGSYLIDYPGSLSEKNVDQWIDIAARTGAKQIDMHCGRTLRFGDLAPDPNMYPHGLDGVKMVIDKLHQAGIGAGLHTYATYIARESKWVSPVPDPRLAKNKIFTLSKDLDAEMTAIWVEEPTQDMSTLTAFFIDNSVTLQIDNELIVYSDIDKQAPYAFTACKRGAWGTQAAPHLKNTPVYHLKEQYGLFNVEGDSTLFTEVAKQTAAVYNQCGFDMIYLDAIGAGLCNDLSIQHAPRYYQGKFIFELCNELKKPALMEMSAFESHYWFARSRMGAWDAPSKAYRLFINTHVQANQSAKKYFLPTNLGWWAIFDWTPKDRMRTFSDDVEYLMCKALASNSSLSWIECFTPASFAASYSQQRYAPLIKHYEELRLSNYFPESVKAKLAEPGRDYTLEQAKDGQWQLRPVNYAPHKISGIDGQSNLWTTQNQYQDQPVKLRIEAMLSLADYNDTGSQVVAEFKEPNEFSEEPSNTGVVSVFETASFPSPTSAFSACFAAKSNLNDPKSAWASVSKTFAAPVDLLERGFGVWIYGDGNGEIINFLWKTPSHISMGVSEHYALIDFKGWRYFEFVEPESDWVGYYNWPYRSPYTVPHSETFWVDYGKLNNLSIWYNNLPAGKNVKCYLSPIKALPHIKAKLSNPSIAIGGKTICFPTVLESGCYLEFLGMENCKVYGPKGELIASVTPQGDIPTLKAGENQVEFNCSVDGAARARATVTLISQDHTVLGK